jgi:hypothetical protein
MKNKFYLITFFLIISAIEISYAQYFSEDGAIPILIKDVRNSIILNTDTSSTDKKDSELIIFRVTNPASETLNKYEIHIYKILGDKLKHYYSTLKTTINYNTASYRWLSDSGIIFWMHSNDTPNVLTQKLIIDGDNLIVDLSK